MINFDEFYRVNHERQIKTIQRYLKSEYEQAEDVVQEAYSRAIKYRNSYNEDLSAINTWFNTILFNVLKEVQNKEVLNEPYEEERHSEELWEQTTHEVFEKELALLKNKKHKHILELFYLVGYSSREIAQVVPNVTQTNVTTIANRFKQRLHKRHGVDI